ncbi:MAG: FKBP-type peptidyl-prolyl cis-trans isomerase [Steroidobacteraceae bacterium]
MRLPLAVAFATVATLTACSQSAQNSTPKTDDEKALYALGVMVTGQVKSFEFTDKEIALVKAGFDDGARDRPKLTEEEMQALIPKLQELQTKRVEAAGMREKEAGTAYLAKAAVEKGATKLPSGVIYTVVKEGTGANPKATDTVKVHYEGKFVDGKVFDSSLKKDPVTFPLNGVIPCWTEGVQQMKVGGEAKLVCPSELAYGDQARPPMRANATLVFDVKLLEIMKEEAPAAAAEPAAPHAAH